MQRYGWSDWNSFRCLMILVVVAFMKPSFQSNSWSVHPILLFTKMRWDIPNTAHDFSHQDTTKHSKRNHPKTWTVHDSAMFSCHLSNCLLEMDIYIYIYYISCKFLLGIGKCKIATNSQSCIKTPKRTEWTPKKGIHFGQLGLHLYIIYFYTC